LLGILLLAGFRVPLFCQPCLQQGITFYSQQQIDSFQINFPACTEIEGDVTIDDGFPVNNITSLISSITHSLIHSITHSLWPTVY
jgi:hypothetical protein